MIPNSNLNPLPIYDSLEKQYHYRFQSYGEILCLIADQRLLLPFQRVVNVLTSSISNVYLVNYETKVELDITTEIVNAGMILKDYTSFKQVIFPSLTMLSITIDIGRWYLKIVTNLKTYYSEVFTTSMAPQDKYLKLIYWDEKSIEYDGGEIDYSDNYKNYLYLDSKIGKPEYPQIENVEVRDGSTYIKSIISKKTYRFVTIGGEYTSDALRILNHHDHIQIRDIDGSIYNIENILVTPKWDTPGYRSIITIEFDVDSVIKKIGYGAKRGDYNNDYNNDYSNEGS